MYSKSAQTLCIADGARVVWQAAASHGRVEGKKQFEGDGRTPEGDYLLEPARRSAKFGSFLRITYPSRADKVKAAALGRKPGGAIGVHGPQRWYSFLGEWQALVNHSDGCIVVDEVSIGELAALVREPLPLTILAD